MDIFLYHSYFTDGEAIKKVKWLVESYPKTWEVLSGIMIFLEDSGAEITFFISPGIIHTINHKLRKGTPRSDWVLLVS